MAVNTARIYTYEKDVCSASSRLFRLMRLKFRTGNDAKPVGDAFRWFVVKFLGSGFPRTIVRIKYLISKYDRTSIFGVQTAQESSLKPMALFGGGDGVWRRGFCDKASRNK
ncbi:unnamed protein product [Toxocara canis]|uniref:GST N-terminal domain-containing protein n=1 Tax=Toxocara canis TaxID=6265 RepID=A0A183UXJ1_TOXCA|nr:unnamed protein product [Toxocara canis]